MENIRTQAIRAVDDFLLRTGMSARRFGVLACGSQHYVRRLRQGTGIQLTTVESAQDFIDRYEHAEPPVDG
jgi:hypothetical protein